MPAALLFVPFIKVMVMMTTMTMMIRMTEMMMTVPRISPMKHLVCIALCFSFLQKSVLWEKCKLQFQRLCTNQFGFINTFYVIISGAGLPRAKIK